MEDAGRKSRVHSRVLEELSKVFHAARAAAGYDRHIDLRRYGIQHLEVEALLDAVRVDTVDDDLAGTAVHAIDRPLKSLDTCIDPAAVAENMELSVHPLHVHRQNDALISVLHRALLDYRRIFDRAAVDAYFVSSALEHAVEVLERVDAASDSKRYEDLRSDLFQNVAEQLSSFERCSDVVEHQLVRAALVIESSHLNGIRHVAYPFKIHSLYDFAVSNIQARHYPFSQHFFSSSFPSVFACPVYLLTEPLRARGTSKDPALHRTATFRVSRPR